MYAFWAIVLLVAGLALGAGTEGADAAAIVLMGAGFGFGVLAVLHYASFGEDGDDD